VGAALSTTGGVPAFAVAITLVAAVLHAVWNAVAHGIPDRLVGFALIGVAYTVIAGAGALVLGLPPAAAWPAIVASAGLHAVYTLLLWTSYELGGGDDRGPGGRRRQTEDERAGPGDHRVRDPDEGEADEPVRDPVRDGVPHRVQHRGDQGDRDGEGRDPTRRGERGTHVRRPSTDRCARRHRRLRTALIR